jgi:antitoxin FitA
MENFTVTLTEDRLMKLKEIAAKYHVAPEELVRASVEELLAQPEEQFEHTLEYVLKKNADLYRRLA